MTLHTPARRTTFATVADRLAGITDPSLADERERDIILRAGSAAMTASIYTLQLLGVCFAVLGAGMWSALIFVGSMIPTLVYSWYCRSAGLDTLSSFAKIAPRRRLITQLIGLVLAVAWAGAIAAHMITGTPLIDAGLGAPMIGESSTGSGLLTGAVVGGIIAMIVLSVSARIGARRSARDAEDDED